MYFTVVHGNAFDDAWVEPDDESDHNQPVALTSTNSNTPDGREVREALSIFKTICCNHQCYCLLNSL